MNEGKTYQPTGDGQIPEKIPELQSGVNIPLATQVPASTVEPPKPEAAPEPAKGWRIGAEHEGHKGLIADCAEAIKNDATIPDHWKNAILTELAFCCAKSQAVQVHAHPQFVNGKFTLSLTIGPLF